MLEIITSDGISLDLSPNAEFSLEMENPLFSSDSVSAAFSTQITFSPTDKNRSVFGYIAAMMLAPQVKSLEATLYFNGFPLMTGKLIYESIEEGELNYTFTASSIDDRMQQKICDIPITYGFGFSSEDDLWGGIRNDQLTGIHAPLMLNQAYTEAETSPGPSNDPKVYINYPFSPLPSDEIKKMPVIDILRILQPARNLIRIDDGLAAAAESLVIVGQYLLNAKKEPVSVWSRLGGAIDFASYLPDITFLDLYNILAAIFSAAFFQDGSSLIMKSAASVLSAPIVNIDDQVNDSFSSKFDAASAYTLGYSGETGDVYEINNLDADIEDGDMEEENGSWYDFLTANYDSGHYSNYHSVIHRNSGQCLSYKVMSPSSYGRMLIDCIYQKHEDFTEGESEEKKEVRIQAKPVKCVPSSLYHYPDRMYRVTPIITIPDKADRGKDVLIGIYGDHQLCDLGWVIDQEDNSDKRLTGNISLSPADIFEAYHADFAAWMALDRQTVTVGLDLTPADVAAWRLFNRFYFRGRRWLCKKLTVTFAAGVETMESEGEFIEL